MIFLSTYFKLNAFPYEFCHEEIEDIIIDIEFEQEPTINDYKEDPPMDIRGDFQMLKQYVNMWYTNYVYRKCYSFMEIDYEEKSSIYKKNIVYDFGKNTKICLKHDCIKNEYIVILLKWLNDAFNFTYKTKNKINMIKITADITKFNISGSEYKGIIKNYVYDVNYFETKDDKIKIVIFMDEQYNITEDYMNNKNIFSSIINAVTNWYCEFVDDMVKASNIERKMKIVEENNIIEMILPNKGINKKNLFFLFKRLNTDSNKIKRVDIFSTDKPFLDYMAKFFDFYEKNKGSLSV